MKPCLLEIAANSLASALVAEASGAHRIELCENLGEGGTTPSYGTIAATRDRVRIPLYVLIRPRAGDFLYNEAETDTMCRDAELCSRLGCDGVVIGALDADGEIDATVCRPLIAAAGALGVTLHRAFDAARDPFRALDAAIDLGCERLLTSGGCDRALDGAPTIAALVQHAGARIKIMAGGAVEPSTLPELRARSGVQEFHASARALRISAMRHRNDALKGLAADWQQTDPIRVRQLLAALGDAPASAS